MITLHQLSGAQSFADACNRQFEGYDVLHADKIIREKVNKVVVMPSLYILGLTCYLWLARYPSHNRLKRRYSIFVRLNSD